MDTDQVHTGWQASAVTLLMAVDYWPRRWHAYALLSVLLGILAVLSHRVLR